MGASLVLASASPRRAELLAQLGLEFSVRSASIDESVGDGEAPLSYVRRMAHEKSYATDLLEGELLLSADTTVIIEGAVLGKPADLDNAKSILKRLSGKHHEVVTAVCARNEAESKLISVRTEVEFTNLSPALIADYLKTREPWDKAGAYALQGIAGSFVRRINGSVTNVIGLPLVETRELLDEFGIDVTVACA
ncbi:MAG: Maf family protein [Pseudomonadota bacterium]